MELAGSVRPRRFFLTLALIICCLPKYSEGCLCHVIPNFACPPPPHCCESGQYTYDECGCCLTCAKSELQPCGGPGGDHGKCAQGLSCLKTCSKFKKNRTLSVPYYQCTIPAACWTIGSDSEPCTFPFSYNGIEYDQCTSADAAEGAVWCATETQNNGTVIEGRWGDCTDGCPGTSK